MCEPVDDYHDERRGFAYCCRCNAANDAERTRCWGCGGKLHRPAPEARPLFPEERL